MSTDYTTMTSKALLTRMTSALAAFQSSTSKFSIVSSINGSTSSSPPRTLYILDSSFNPPSIAHYTLAHSALKAALKDDSIAKPIRLLLLFATLNADKAAQPASTPHRLAMMVQLAEDLAKSLNSSAHAQQLNNNISIDVALTTEPYYTNKSTAIAASTEYMSKPTHVHLIGFDTFTRMFNSKYYPSFSPPLSALSPYFDTAGHRLRVTLRPDDEFGTLEEQRAFLRRLTEGEMEQQGARSHWAQQIEFVGPNPKTGVSSTKIREAAKRGNWDIVNELCPPSVAQWVQQNKLSWEQN
ncbi:Hypothetical protein R9X50_00504800 [Acrodontium crateriforme]|uniref:Nicotinamide-nucleotide adenylyltransferase n=1 Tax=Acrodontium crateriforme TaxID=150365 RepID=A0AAQ3M6P8_9PEZI|nr:Hypothetical protein R9X50_00504800 [Acrodontium crateriforme]